jgi:hypothetical protein
MPDQAGEWVAVEGHKLEPTATDTGAGRRGLGAGGGRVHGSYPKKGNSLVRSSDENED